jgi:hypothetical protein
MPFLLTATFLALGLPRSGLPALRLQLVVLRVAQVLLSDRALSVRCRLASRCGGSEGGMMGGSLASASRSSCKAVWQQQAGSKGILPPSHLVHDMWCYTQCKTLAGACNDFSYP